MSFSFVTEALCSEIISSLILSACKVQGGTTESGYVFLIIRMATREGVNSSWLIQLEMVLFRLPDDAWLSIVLEGSLRG